MKYFAREIETAAKHFKVRAFRYGNGDEFAVICSQFFAQRIRDRVERTARDIDYGNFTVSISGEVGFSVTEADSKLQARKAAKKSSGQNF